MGIQGIMEKGEDKKTMLKRWVRANGDNGSEMQYPAIRYETAQMGERLTFSIGENWTEKIDRSISSFKVMAIEDIIIPAGKYRCFKIVEEIKNSGIKNYYWFASSIGLVKCEIHRMTAVLQNYSV